MKHATLATSADIAAWANRMEAAAQLPRLIRLLAHATAQDVSRIGFPADEGIRAGGYDGVLVAGGGDPCVPSGMSVWELSTRADVTVKANQDYRKRTTNPHDATPAETTYVAVIARQWPGREAWVRERQAEGIWKAVQALDAHDLEQWLERAPGVHLWLSELMGLHPEGAHAVEPFWDDWTSETDPAMDPALVLAGRALVAVDIHRWLRDSTPTLVLRAESREEAIAVFLAALMQLDPEERAAYLARSTIVTTQLAWRAVADHHSGLILIPDPNLDVEGGAIAAERRGHRVVVPLGLADMRRPGVYEIPRLSVEAAAAALKAAGQDERRARELAALARRSLQAYRRRVGRIPELRQPEWAKPQNAPGLIPILLLGSWNGAKEGDRKALEALAGRPYAEIEPLLARWAIEDDPPFRRVGDRWYLLSREDAWFVLSRSIQRSDMERFKDQALLVLGTPNPKFDLPDNDRWWAAVSGHVPSTSSELCESMAETLAILGARGGSTDAGDGTTAADYAAGIARDILTKANRDWRIWASLSDWGVLPLLAEAAPDVFLDAVEAGLTGEVPLRNLFRDGGGADPIFSSSPHTGLLWALEVLAWSPQHLSRAALALANLARIDPGGQLQNRPLHSLREIFLSWNAQTAAPLASRTAALDVIRARVPDIAWNLMVKLLPEFQSSASPTVPPKWREWAVGVPPHPSNTDVAGTIVAVLERVLGDAGAQGRRWAQVISSLGAYSLEHHNAIVAGIHALDAAHMSEPDRAIVWHALREFISHHRAYPEGKWALPEKLLGELEALMPPFEPQDPVERYGWLFGYHAQLLSGGESHDYEAHDRSIEAEQDRVLAALYATDGLAALKRMIPAVQVPGYLGHTLGRSSLSDANDREILETDLASADTATSDFANGFVAGRVQRSGAAWAEAWLADVSLSPEQKAELVLALPPDAHALELASQLGPEGEKRYWSRVNVWQVDPALAETATRKLIAHGQPQMAVDLLGRRGADASTALILDALEATLTAPDRGRLSPLFAHNLEDLFDALAEDPAVDRPRVAQLEWGFLPLLERRHKRPRFLHQELAANPDFFVDVLCVVFRGHNEPPRDLTPEEKLRAKRAYALLDTWRHPPGLENGALDPDALLSWLRAAREKCAQRDRAVIGDEIIGQVLSGAPAAADGSWPDPALERVIEEMASPAIERGIELGVFNGRGVVSKGIWDGGTEEQAIADRLNRDAESVAARAPRTAAMLRHLSRNYRGEAHRLDQDAAVREDFDR